MLRLNIEALEETRNRMFGSSDLLGTRGPPPSNALSNYTVAGEPHQYHSELRSEFREASIRYTGVVDIN